MANTGVKTKINGKYQRSKTTTQLFAKHKRKHEANIRSSLQVHGREVTKELKKVIITSVGSGRHYPGLPKRSSAPGQAPVNQNGKLASMFLYRTAPYYLQIANKAEYASFLDDGTTKMKARPYFKVTIEALEYRLEKDLQNLES